MSGRQRFFFKGGWAQDLDDVALELWKLVLALAGFSLQKRVGKVLEPREVHKARVGLAKPGAQQHVPSSLEEHIRKWTSANG